MGRKKVLEKRLKRLMEKKSKLVARSQESTDVNEVRSINDQLAELNEEINETQEEIKAIEEEERAGAPGEGGDPQNPEQRTNSNVIPANARAVGMNVVGTFNQQTTRTNDDPYGTMEYRNAFKTFVQRGTPIPKELLPAEARANGPTDTVDLGATIPTTIMNEFVEKLRGVYGQVYSKVRKLNIRGGVKIPISDLKASFKWISEKTTADREKAGEIKEFVEFSYNIGEIRVSQTLLASIIALKEFESEVVQVMTEAFLQAMDEGIVNGTGEGQLLGITNDPRVTKVVEFTEAEIGNWQQWRKKLFAKLPLKKRKGQFLFTNSTLESHLLTMADSNGNPIFKTAAELNINDDSIEGRFFGRDVTLVEPTVISDFDTAEDGDVIGIYGPLNDYAVNTNLQFGITRYFDQEKNEWVNKALVVVDGKVVDPQGFYILKKASKKTVSNEG